MRKLKSYSNIIRLRSQHSCTSSETTNEVQSNDAAEDEETMSNLDGFGAPTTTDGAQVPIARKKTRTCWEVNVINEEGIVKNKKLKSVEVWNLPPGERVIVQFDRFGVPTTDAAGLYASALSSLATQSSSFPINYSDWRLLPVQYKDDVFEKSIKAKFQFQDDCASKGWTLKSIGKKWKDFKCRLLVENYDPSLSRNELIMECPLEIQQDQWEIFVNYRLSQQAKEISKKKC